MTSTIFLVFCPLVSRAEEQAGGGLAPGVIAAIAVGAVVGVVVAVGLVAYFQCGKMSKSDGNDGVVLSVTAKATDSVFVI